MQGQARSPAGGETPPLRCNLKYRCRGRVSRPEKARPPGELPRQRVRGLIGIRTDRHTLSVTAMPCHLSRRERLNKFAHNCKGYRRGRPMVARRSLHKFCRDGKPVPYDVTLNGIVGAHHDAHARSMRKPQIGRFVNRPYDVAFGFHETSNKIARTGYLSVRRCFICKKITASDTYPKR